MKKFFGTALIIAGVLALADFLIWGSLNAKIEGTSSSLFRPLLATGQQYPEYISKLCFGLGMFVFGLYLLLLEGDMGRCPLSLIFMLNSLLLLFALLIAFAAAMPGADPTQANPVKDSWVGIASAAAALFVITGLFLLYFAATERPVGRAGLSIGSVIYVSSVAVGTIVFLSGKAA